MGVLPSQKDVVQVFGDFLNYMYACAVDFIKESHVDGPGLWNTVQHSVRFVLSHPNGWEGPQQAKMRRSAVYGGLIPNTPEGHARVMFVTEGEASMHACLSNGLGPATLQVSLVTSVLATRADVLIFLQVGDAFIIADAGGGTLDFNTYEIKQISPLLIEEIAVSDCKYVVGAVNNLIFLSVRSICGLNLRQSLREANARRYALPHIAIFTCTQPSS